MVFKSAVTALKVFCQDEQGATAIEYAMIGALISIVIVASATAIGQALIPGFESIVDGLGNGTGG